MTCSTNYICHLLNHMILFLGNRIAKASSTATWPGPCAASPFPLSLCTNRFWAAQILSPGRHCLYSFFYLSHPQPLLHPASFFFHTFLPWQQNHHEAGTRTRRWSSVSWQCSPPISSLSWRRALDVATTKASSPAWDVLQPW